MTKAIPVNRDNCPPGAQGIPPKVKRQNEGGEPFAPTVTTHHTTSRPPRGKVVSPPESIHADPLTSPSGRKVAGSYLGLDGFLRSCRLVRHSSQRASSFFSFPNFCPHLRLVAARRRSVMGLLPRRKEKKKTGPLSPDMDSTRSELQNGEEIKGQMANVHVRARSTKGNERGREAGWAKYFL